MTLTSSPPTLLEQTAAPTEVLFREAHARRRQRWVWGAILTVVTLVALVVSLVASFALGSTSHLRLKSGHVSSPAVLSRSGSSAAWVDYSGNLHVGGLATGSQHIVTHAGASPTTPLVAIGDDIFWVRMSNTPSSAYQRPVVDELNVSSGSITPVARGQTIFLSIDSRDLFVVQSNSSLLELPIGRSGPSRTFAIPPGWYLTAGGGYSNPIVVANGIVVQSSQGQTGKTPPTAAIWDPNTGGIIRLGRDQGLIGAYTPAGALYSLLAWVPGSCETDPHCSLLVTNTRTMTSIRIHSPLPYGFDVGGAFSPSGRRLALFIKTNSGDYDPSTQLAVANVHTGQLRRVPRAAGQIGESVGWVRWISDTSSLIAGTFSTNYTRYNHYLVDVQTLTARVLDFSDNRDIDINFSAVVLPGP